MGGFDNRGALLWEIGLEVRRWPEKCVSYTAFYLRFIKLNQEVVPRRRLERREIFRFSGTNKILSIAAADGPRPW